MSSFASSPRSSAGSRPHVAGAFAPVLGPWLAGALALAIGCKSTDEHQTLPPTVLGMSSNDAPFYSDGQTTIYESKKPVPLPVLAPAPDDIATLRQTKVSPYGRLPWVSKDDVRLQVSWTLSNIDDAAHDVELLVDPWNEFVRYWPGINIGELRTLPDLSGIDILTRVEGKSRISGVFTYDDLDELATDLATVENLIDVYGPKLQAAQADGGATDALSLNTLVNHAFDVHNRTSEGDPLSKPYVPGLIAGLVGFDLGLRASEASNVALEVVVEIVDASGAGKVEPEGNLIGVVGMPRRALSAPPNTNP